METESFYGQNPTGTAVESEIAATSFREKGKNSSFQSFAMEIVPGTTCQLNCESCYKSQKKNGNGNGKTPLPDAINFIDQASEVGFREIILMGGEPTLHPSLRQMMEHVKRKGLQLIMTTNGIALQDPEKAQILSGIDATVVTHAYFPGGEELIDRYSGRRGYAEILKRAIDNIRQIPGTNIVLEMPLSDSLFPKAFEFFKFCRESGVIPFIEISRSRDNGTPTTHISPEQVAELFQSFQDYDRQYFPELADNTISPPAYGNKCTMSITGIHLKNFGGGDFGKVFSCCAQGIAHGNMREEPLEAIMRSPAIALFKRQDDYIVGPCADCDIYDICRGGCRGEAYLKFGCPRASSPSCHRIAEEVRNDVKLMAPASCIDCDFRKLRICSIKQ